MALLTDCVIATSATKPVRLVVRPLQEVARSMSVLENADIFMVVVLPVQFEQWQLPVCLSLSLVYFFFFSHHVRRCLKNVPIPYHTACLSVSRMLSEGHSQCSQALVLLMFG